MTYTKDDFRQIFQQPFNATEWQQVLLHFFQATELKAEPEHTAGTTDEECGYYLGNINTAENYLIGLFYYKIQHGSVARKRVGLRNLVKSLVHPTRGDFDAALVVFDSGSQWRLSFICDMKGESTAPKRYTYVFGESDNYYNTPVSRFDTLQRKGISFANIMEAFSVESLNKDFFNQYKAQYKKFCDFLHDDPEMCQSFRSFLNQGKAIRDYVKKMMGRIVFLYFVQRKGWLNGDSRYMSNMFSLSSDDVKADFLDRVLEPMFFGLLNTTQEQRKVNAQSNGWDLSLIPGWQNIPYLNGGLFEQDEIDKCKSVFPTAYFEELFEFFDAYNFTIDENDPDDSEVGIDPEMLGHIFENLLEDNKDKGAFYTPKEIVQYMCRESVIQYLKTHEPDERFAEAIEHLIRDGEVDKVLQDKATARKFTTWLAEVKVCDPAIGSGAFPMGVLNVLYHSRQLLYGFTKENHSFSPSEVKREIIQNNIYGVDIEQGAVDIARLRFWLSLVVDEIEPQPLPNLDYKIVCGNSLLHRFALDAPFQNVLKDYNQKNGTNYTLGDYRQWVYDYTNLADHTQKDTFRRKIEDIKYAFKTELSKKEKREIAKVRGAIDNLQMEDMFGGKQKEAGKKIKDLQKELKALEQQREEIESNIIYENAFEWRFEFPALLDENGNFIGFDIVIGNPPYGVSIKGQYRKAVVGLWGNVPDYEIYYYFMQVSEALLVENGIMSYIIPNTYLFNTFAKNYRIEILNHWKVIEILDCTKFPIFESATVRNTINIWQKSVTDNNLVGYRNTKGSTSFSTLIEKNKEYIEKKDLLKLNQNWGLAFCLSSIYIRIVNKISSCSKTIQTFFPEITQGLIAYDKYRGQSADIIRNRAYHYNSYRDGLKRWLWGEDVRRYFVKWNKKEYIDYCDGIANPRHPIFFVGKRLLVREITNPSIFATITTEELYNDPAIIIIKDSIEYSIEVVLAILNSKLATFYHFNHSPKATKGAFPKILVQDVKDFPLPDIPDENRVIIENLVGKIIKIKQENPQAATNDYENEIDKLVYRLYGLTYDEVKIIEPQTPITKDEYENIKI